MRAITINQFNSEVVFSDEFFALPFFLRREFLIQILRNFLNFSDQSARIYGTNQDRSLFSFLFQLPFLFGGYTFIGGVIRLPRSPKSKRRRVFNDLLAGNSLFTLHMGAELHSPGSLKFQNTRGSSGSNAGGDILYRNIQNPLVEGIAGHADVLAEGYKPFRRLVSSWCNRLESSDFELRPHFVVGRNTSLGLDSLADDLLVFTTPGQQCHVGCYYRLVRSLHGLYGEAATFSVWRLLCLDCCACVESVEFPSSLAIQEYFQSEEGEDGEGVW
ncbi:P0 protein [Chickpea leafroll virus]|uniref:P0 protein n=1 Tax=Chickpea leafroll virus TaxID=2989852 RepID=A0AAE9P9F3_9VIRU|nr:P0 protein [Chickpea leafroll virus]